MAEQAEIPEPPPEPTLPPTDVIYQSLPLPFGLHNMRGLFGFALIGCFLVTTAAFFFDSTLFLVLTYLAHLHEIYGSFRLSLGGHRFVTRMRAAWNEDYSQEYNLLKTGSSIPLDEAVMWVIVPNYKERKDILRATLSEMGHATLAASNVIIVLAMEAREEGGKTKADEIALEFAGVFRDIVFTNHPVDPNELPGKASNENYCARELRDHIDRSNVLPENSLVFVCDADSLVPGKLVDHLITRFCVSPERYYTTWVPGILNFGCFFDVPAISRFMSGLAALDHLSGMISYPDFKTPWSTYAISYVAAQKVDFWCPNNCSEDWHMFYKCVSRLGDRYKTESVYLPVVTSLVGQADTWIQGVRDRYQQAKRHALSVQELDFFAVETLRRWVVKDEAHVEDLSIGTWLRLFWRYLDPSLSAYGVIFMFLSFNLYCVKNIAMWSWLSDLLMLPDTLIIPSPLLTLLMILNALYALNTIAAVLAIFRILWFMEDQLPDRMYPPSGKDRTWMVLKYIFEGFFWAPAAGFVMGVYPLTVVAIKQIFTAEYKYITAPKPTTKKKDADGGA